MDSDHDNDYLVDIKSKNFTLRTKYGKIIRTPIKFYIKAGDKLYWDMQIAISGIKDFNIVKLVKNVIEPTQNVETKVVEELVRPSTQHKRE